MDRSYINHIKKKERVSVRELSYESKCEQNGEIKKRVDDNTIP